MVSQLITSYAGVMVFEAGGVGALPADLSEPAGGPRKLPAIDLKLIRKIGRSRCVVVSIADAVRRPGPGTKVRRCMDFCR